MVHLVTAKVVECFHSGVPPIGESSLQIKQAGPCSLLGFVAIRALDSAAHSCWLVWSRHVRLVRGPLCCCLTYYYCLLAND